MKSKGLAMTIVFQAESANYGESLGNISALKKISRNNGDQYTYISRQAIRYNMMEQIGEKEAPVKAEGSGDKKVIQFLSEATITDFPELDFFGYLKTEKGTQGQKRSAKVRLSNAISLETFKADLDFLTNKGQADKVGENMNIAQAEIHRSYYRYTVTIDLDQIGIDGQIQIDNKEKSRRVQKLMDTISFLYRDIRGRREDLKPLFVIGGVYDVKNPVFQNVVDIKDNKVLVESILGILDYSGIKENTKCGVIKNQFDNTSEIEKELNAESVPAFFNDLKEKIDAYYESN
ncbi:type I-B CRISPR-associated protein Cas7/Cst2/DevR [Listeria cornellensis]|uniref:Crispr-associated regulatory protein n=1 Tax=Listeria cornellensis FSL F6-0969 TaxID=1265820 RepID=W7BZM4_9LIST|nr:type I-B CRISPR-associated protein Cas7/Cst2/DevR [Listeria cornellensis]EUJ32649.1 crispr-associated regulatory protein [Listeria cornellensis FSL F6-0969]